MRAFLLFFGLIGGLALARNSAAETDSVPMTSSTTVSEEIRTHADESLRDQVLQELRSESRQPPLANWLNGKIEWQGEWENVTALEKQLQDDARLKEYRQRRDGVEDTYEEHVRLASWAKRHGLPQQSMAHTTRALELKPSASDPDLRPLIELARGQTLTPRPTDREELSRLAKQVEKGNRYWVPKIKRLRQQLRSKSIPVRQQAREEIREIADPFALPALQMALTDTGLSDSKSILEAISGIPSHQAAELLAQQALFNPWKSVREQASEHLRQRSPESWVPSLLASMETEISQRVSWYFDRNTTQVSHVLENENQNRRSVGRVDSLTSAVPARVGARTGRLSDIRAPSETSNVQTVAVSAVLGQLEIRQAAREVARTNESIEQWNEAVCEVLRRGTGIELATDPRQWWDWWDKYNYVVRPELKPTSYWRRSSLNSPTPVAIDPEFPTCECLLPGTLISTDQGLLPIEEIRRGDLVLSQRPHTGELTYQPVLGTTYREKAETYRVELEGDAFTATGGHTFWIVGQGWVKTRDMRPGQILHTADGQTKIVGIEPAEPADTYNLVVAGFSTYFVGSARVLSHDVTIASPVDQLVPGQRLVFKSPELLSKK